MTNVIPFGDVVPPGQVNEELAEELESLLEDVKAGEIVSIAYVTVRKNNVLGTGWVGSGGTRDSLGTAIMMLHHRYAAAIMGGEDDE